MKVVVCVWDPAFRSSVTKYIEAQGHEVIAETETAFEAAEVAVRFRPEVVVIDPGVQAGSSLDVLDELYRVNARFAIVVFSGRNLQGEPARPRATLVGEHDFEGLAEALRSMAPAERIDRRQSSPRPGVPARDEADITDSPDFFYAALEQARRGDTILAVSCPDVDRLIDACRASVRASDFILRQAAGPLILLMTDDPDTPAVVKSRIRQTWPDPHELRILSATIAEGDWPRTVLSNLLDEFNSGGGPPQVSPTNGPATGVPVPGAGLPIGLASTFGTSPTQRRGASRTPPAADAPPSPTPEAPAREEAALDESASPPAQDAPAAPPAEGPEAPPAPSSSEVAPPSSEPDSREETPADGPESAPGDAATAVSAGPALETVLPATPDEPTESGPLGALRALSDRDRKALAITVVVALIGIVLAVALTGRSSGGKDQVATGPPDTAIATTVAKAPVTLVDGVVSASDLGAGWAPVSPPGLLPAAVYQAGPCKSPLWSSNVSGARSAFVKKIGGADNAEVISTVFVASSAQVGDSQRAFVTSPTFLPCLKLDAGAQAKALFGGNPQADVKVEANPLSIGLSSVAAATQLNITVLAPNGPVTITDDSVQFFSGPYESTLDVSWCTCAPLPAETFRQVLSAASNRLANLPPGGFSG